MYDVFFYILKTSLEELQPPYMDMDSFVPSFSNCNVDDKHVELE